MRKFVSYIKNGYDFAEYNRNANEHLKLLDLSYYFVPLKAFGYENWMQKLQPMDDLDDWGAVYLGDTDYKDGRSIGECFDCIGELVWQLKAAGERLTFRAKRSKWRNTYHDALILSSIEASEEVCEYIGRQFVFVYEKDSVVNKIVTVSSGEIVECFYHKDVEPEVEAVLAKWATKTEYYKYELGE